MPPEVFGVASPLGDLGFPVSVQDLEANAAAQNLEGCWVVILMDLEGGDWSPWTVVALDYDQAVAKARQDWCDWLQWEGDPDHAEVVKVYAKSWIGEIVFQ